MATHLYFMGNVCSGLLHNHCFQFSFTSPSFVSSPIFLQCNSLPPASRSAGQVQYLNQKEMCCIIRRKWLLVQFHGFSKRGCEDNMPILTSIKKIIYIYTKTVYWPSPLMSPYICVRACMYMCLYVYTCIYISTFFINMYTYIYMIYIHICIHIYNTYICTSMYLCTLLCGIYIYVY